MTTTEGTSAGPGPVPDPVHPLIHQAVADQARLRPEAIAMVFRDERTDYRTLDAAADRFAGQLAALGVGPGGVVPVQMPRTPHLVAVLLAVLKCGAAYAAFDHRWPAERVDALLDQLRPPVFVTADRAGTAAQPVWQPPAEPIGTVAAPGGGAPAVEVDPSAPACVFFTSGTTGTPKGVVSPHRATTRLFGPGGLPGYRPGGVTTQSAPCAWDAYSLEVWGMLTTGGTVVAVEEDYLLPGALRDLVKSAGVDTVFLTCSLFNLFVDMDLDCFLGTSQIYTGGERLSVDHVRRFLARHPEVALFNAYGPVESCVYATLQPIRVEDCDTPGGIPIGRPVAATEVHVLDGDDQVCEPGTEGEICVGGTGLAVEYLGLPELTAEKFPVVTVAGTAVRVYRTGDLGFHDADGVLHFRGRADRQVKVRGFRIEPGEIENAAMRIDGVRRCTVVPVPGRMAAWEQLALFYTTDLPGTGSGAQDPAGVAAELAKALPPYLVPDAVRAVAEFPMTANGKIDNQALLESLPS